MKYLPPINKSAKRASFTEHMISKKKRRYSPKLQQLHTQISALKGLELSRPITVVSSQEDKDKPSMS